MPANTDKTPDIEPIVVLDLIMPHGKRMRDCTDAEMKKFGDLFLKKRAKRQKGEDEPESDRERGRAEPIAGSGLALSGPIKPH